MADFLNIIVTGNPVDGFEFYGPFKDSEEAATVGNTDAHFSNKEWWTAPLYPVEDDDKQTLGNYSDLPQEYQDEIDKGRMTVEQAFQQIEGKSS